MHRPKLILRRFHDLGIGLGYFENGAWIDHGAPEAAWVVGSATEAERAALDAVHAWFDCCGRATSVVPVPVEAVAAGPAAALPASGA